MTETNKNILSVDCDFVKDSKSLVELIKFVLQYNSFVLIVNLVYEAFEMTSFVYHTNKLSYSVP